jgi:hypothetical protein
VLSLNRDSRTCENDKHRESKSEQQLFPRHDGNRIKTAVAPGQSDCRRIATFSSTCFNKVSLRRRMLLWDDLAKWLLGELRKCGVHASDERGQEDFGWYLNSEVERMSHCFVLLYRSDDVREGAT